MTAATDRKADPMAGTGGAGASVAETGRPLLSTVLVCEAVVIALAIPVAISVLDVSAGLAGGVCGGLAVLCLLLPGLLRRPWSVPVGTALQAAIFLTGFLVPTMFFLGVLFGALWWTALRMARRAAAAAAANSVENDAENGGAAPGA
ncbi:DUF4233 domain-containing protein [Actinomadura atramentaria]|uniref:DUF4233 domain-containing protein n=1 Tax=Actinomadura atramentaria TaxID=1990 RepID=UPI00037DDEF8|nr:DUF4233 domain-containing protein [Actinomadura atramentaria]